MDFYDLDPLQDPRWSEFVARHPRGGVYHSTQWLNALHTAYGYRPLVLTSSAPGAELVSALVFCRIESWLTGRRLVSLPFSDHCEPLFSDMENLSNLVHGAEEIVHNDRWKYLELRPLTPITANVNLGINAHYCVHWQDLNRSCTEIFRQSHKSCIQRKIRRAEREHLQYEEGNSDNLLRRFYSLQVMTRRRLGYPPQPMRWFRVLANFLGNQLKVRVASKNGIPIASIITLQHKRTMTYKYGCSDIGFNNLGGVSLLLWNALQEAKQLGCDRFDWGRSNIENQGLIAYKERWGATRSTVSYLRYPINSKRAEQPWNLGALKHVVRHMPTSSLIAAGRVLYPHIG